MSDGALSRTDTALPPPNPRLEALKSWLAANNVQLSPKVEIRVVPSDADETHEREESSSSFAIYAADDSEPDEILAVTPRRAILSRRTCSLAASTAFQQLCDAVELATPQQAGVRILAVALTHEILLGNKSFWDGYVQSMPQTYEEVGLPTFWEDETALSWLRGTDIPAYMQHQKCTKVRRITTIYLFRV